MELSDKQIGALAQHESKSKPRALGDGGKAFGVYQMHNDFRSDWYGTTELLTLIQTDRVALVNFAAGFYQRFKTEWSDLEHTAISIPDETLELLMLCYNQGVRGAAEWLLGDPGRTPADHPYVKKYLETLTSA